MLLFPNHFLETVMFANYFLETFMFANGLLENVVFTNYLLNIVMFAIIYWKISNMATCSMLDQHMSYSFSWSTYLVRQLFHAFIK